MSGLSLFIHACSTDSVIYGRIQASKSIHKIFDNMLRIVFTMEHTVPWHALLYWPTCIIIDLPVLMCMTVIRHATSKVKRYFIVAIFRLWFDELMQLWLAMRFPSPTDEVCKIYCHTCCYLSLICMLIAELLTLRLPHFSDVVTSNLKLWSLCNSFVLRWLVLCNVYLSLVIYKSLDFKVKTSYNNW